MSKRALRMAKAMAAKDARFIGKSADAGVAEWLPVATAILDGFKPTERALKRILRENDRRLDQMAARTLPGAHGQQPQPPDEAYIKSRAETLVHKRMQDFGKDWLAEPPVNGNGHQHGNLPAKDIHPDWKDIEGFFS